MKQILTTLLLAYSVSAIAADPPPLPPNPFSNLPSQSQAGFDPFADEDSDDGSQKPSDSRANTQPPSSSSPSPAPDQPRSSKVGYEDPTKSKMTVESFDYPDAEIIDVARAISRLTGKNFIYNPQDIKGRMSITSETAITVADAWNAFLAALNMKGFALVPSGKHYRIERLASAKEKQTPLLLGDGEKGPKNEELVTQIIQLRYIDASEAEIAFRFFIPREANIKAFRQTNTLIVTDTAININRLKELLGHLDVAGHQESIFVVPIRNAAAKDIAKMISDIVVDGGSAGTSVSNIPRTGVRPTPTFTSRTSSTRGSSQSGGSSISKIIADDRTNSLIVKANAAGIREIRSIVRRLDTKVSANEGSGRIHVVRLQFAEAEQLAKTLSGFTQGGSANNNANRTAFPIPFGTQNTGVFQGEIKVSAEPTTQSLVITASPQDFATLKKVIEKLDVPRDQVFVQAIVMEMRLNRDNAFGTSFVSANNGIGLPSASGNLTSMLSGNPLAASGLVLGFKKGFERQVEVPDGKGGKQSFRFNSLNGLIEFIQGNTDSNVLATPQIIALDNKEATMEISDEVKVQETSVTGNTSTTSFKPDTAGLILKVKPQINKASNFVKLDITQKLENFDASQVPQSLQGSTVGKNKRSTETSVIVQNEDTVVLSGMMRESNNEITQKVPILGDIPILGWLFKNSKSEVRKTNLLIFITPTIIKQYDAIRKVLTDRLDEREDFVKEFYGTRDPFGKHMKKMRSKLPDLHVFSALPTTPTTESTSIPAPQSSTEEDSTYDDWSDAPPAMPPPIPWGEVSPQFDSQPDYSNEAPPPPPPIDFPPSGSEF